MIILMLVVVLVMGLAWVTDEVLGDQRCETCRKLDCDPHRASYDGYCECDCH